MKMSKLEKYFVNGNGHSASVSRRAEQLLRYAQPQAGQRYLDVGTGNGAAAASIARIYELEVTGVDVDPEQIRLAQKAGSGVLNAHFQTLDGRDLLFSNGSFDIVSAFKVTHHIPNWPDALAEMLRVVKEGGYFVYSDLIAPAWLAAVGERTMRSAGYPTLEGLEEVADAHGLYTVYESRALVLYDAVFCKGAGVHKSAR